MKILVCSDGHPAAEQAIQFIAALAPGWEAQVVLLGIVEHDADEPALQMALDRGAGLLEASGVSVEVVTRTGAPLAEIRRHTQAGNYDFAAIGAVCKGSGPYALSKKAYDLVRELDLPVMIVSAGNRPAAIAGRLLLCCGGRQGADSVVNMTVRLAAKPKWPVTLLHVMPDAPAMFANLAAREVDPELLLSSRSALARRLAQERDLVVGAGLEAAVVLRQGPVAPEILEEARTGKYDFIVMGSAPAQGPLRHYVMGDVAAAVLKDADCPVLIMRTGPPLGGGLLGRLLGGLFSRKL